MSPEMLKALKMVHEGDAHAHWTAGSVELRGKRGSARYLWQLNLLKLVEADPKDRRTETPRRVGMVLTAAGKQILAGNQ